MDKRKSRSRCGLFWVNRKGHRREMDFYQKMGYVCTRIPRGKVATYGQIALLCGSPNHARQVGYALRKERAGEQVPAHRIVNAAGRLSGAAAFESPDMQKQLLEKEGVQVQKTENGWKVDLKKYGWKHTLEEAEEFYDLFEKDTSEGKGC